MAVVCAGLGAVAAAGLLTFGGTNALFTSQAGQQTNTITAGTVTLAENGSVSQPMNVSNFMPGDGSCYSPPAGALYSCNHPRNKYALEYTGSNPAFVGLNFTVTSTAAKACRSLTASTSYAPSDVVASCTGLGQLPLFDGQSGSGDLDLSLTPENSDTAHQLVLDSNLVGATNCATNANSKVTCTSTINNILMPVHSGADQTALQWVTGSTDIVQVDTGLPTTAGNQFQGSNVTFTLQSNAVQWDNNATTNGSCDPATTFPNGLSGIATAPCPISWG